MTTWWRRLGAPGAIALATAVVVLTAAVVRLPGSSIVPRLPGLHEPDYSRDAKTKLAPLRRDFVAQRIGGSTLERVAPAEGPAKAAPHSGTGGNKPAPSQARTNSAQTAADHTFISNVLSPGQWDLRLDFAADRDVVAPGGDILYTLTVRNAGRAPFNGRLELRSHVPLFTNHVSEPVCAIEAALQLAMARTESCPLPGLPLPQELQDVEIAGQPLPLSALTWTIQAAVAPGETLTRTFRVTVDPGADGRDISNHGHISVLGSPSLKSRDVVVHVSSALPVHP
jgi:uncharacterized repeat protein (TIGR01451 family)